MEVRGKDRGAPPFSQDCGQRRTGCGPRIHLQAIVNMRRFTSNFPGMQGCCSEFTIHNFPLCHSLAPC